MRIRGLWIVGLVACTSAAWMACGGDDAAVNDTTSDSGTSDATIGDGNTGSDSGNPGDAGAQDSAPADDGGCHVVFPSLPAGEVVCPGASGGECDSGACCGNHCATKAVLCAVDNGLVACERASDCADHPCCLKLNADIDLDASTCPLTGTAKSITCTAVDKCAAGDYVACASDAECDGGTCRALSIQIVDGGTILGVCAP